MFEALHESDNFVGLSIIGARRGVSNISML